MSKTKSRLQIARDRVADIEAKIERCDEKIASVTSATAELDDLLKERDEIIARAFIDGSSPDTSDCDQRIAAVKKSNAEVLAQAQIAQNARAILDTQLAEANGEFHAAEEERNIAYWKLLSEERGRACSEYNAALNTMRECLNRMDIVSGLSGLYKVPKSVSALARIPGSENIKRVLDQYLCDSDLHRVSFDRGYVDDETKKHWSEVHADVVQRLGLDG
ncbi:hypothetical protein [Castellaniella sp. MT123]|uniref:hypothetical protein n=1 Tax=Castellaniella sp. MT123 TaxID=3140381 RepID=UPI0031F3C03E